MDFFRTKSIYSINEVEWWLLKYSDKYNELRNFCECSSMEDDELPCICKITMQGETRLFLDTYYDLEELCEYHRYEKYALIQLQEYQEIKDCKERVKECLIKNEKIGCEDLALFLIDYLDYSENEDENIDLLAYRNEKDKIEIFVNRQDFENLIEFKELFDELYYVKKLYPEGLKRIEEEMKTTANNGYKQLGRK